MIEKRYIATKNQQWNWQKYFPSGISANRAVKVWLKCAENTSNVQSTYSRSKILIQVLRNEKWIAA